VKIAYSKEALQRIDEIIMDAITDPNVAPDTSEIAKKIVAAGITRLDGSPVPNGTISSRAFYLRTGHGGNF
jgi:hypothetical protein